VHVPPKGGEKIIWPNLQRKVVSAPLRQIRSPLFEEIGEIWQWERLLRQFWRVLGLRLKKIKSAG